MPVHLLIYLYCFSKATIYTCKLQYISGRYNSLQNDTCPTSEGPLIRAGRITDGITKTTDRWHCAPLTDGVKFSCVIIQVATTSLVHLLISIIIYVKHYRILLPLLNADLAQIVTHYLLSIFEMHVFYLYPRTD